MSKEIVNSPAGDTVGELEQQVRLSLWEETAMVTWFRDQLFLQDLKSRA